MNDDPTDISESLLSHVIYTPVQIGDYFKVFDMRNNPKRLSSFAVQVDGVTKVKVEVFDSSGALVHSDDWVRQLVSVCIVF
jgi:hypothetical protein